MPIVVRTSAGSPARAETSETQYETYCSTRLLEARFSTSVANGARVSRPMLWSTNVLKIVKTALTTMSATSAHSGPMNENKPLIRSVSGCSIRCRIS